MANPAQFEQYIREINPQQGINLLCMDDRFAQGPYLQLRGAGYGFAKDFAIAMEVVKPGSFMSQGQPVHVLGGLMTRALAGKGITLGMHEECAAFLGDEAIDETLLNRPEDVLAESVKVNPNVTRNNLDQVSEISKRMRAAGLIARTNVAEAALRGGMDVAGQHIDGITFTSLVKSPHRATDVAVIDDPRYYFDTEAAWQDGNYAYAINNDLRAISSQLTMLPNVDPQILSVVSAIGHGSTMLNLPRPNGQPLAVHRIAA